jgi:predicted site-specific integrase-resolvase
MALKDSSGNIIPTIADAAARFGVTRKTIRQWIGTGIIEPPPEMDYGARSIQVFPPEYLDKAEEAVKKHREEKKTQRRAKGPVRRR